MDDLTAVIRRDGFAVMPRVLDASTVESLRTALARVTNNAAPGEAQRTRAGTAFGIRNLLNLVPEVRDFSCDVRIRALVTSILGEEAQVVRGIYFDKDETANWKVPWHQDLTIAVRQQIDVPGFGPWSVKAGIPHVQPPIELLERMLTVRLHLDDTDVSNGALQVIPGSHWHGRLSAAQIQERRARGPRIICAVPCGGALVMRPLLLHASSAAPQPRHRRVVHLEFAAADLPGGLEWYGS